MTDDELLFKFGSLSREILKYVLDPSVNPRYDLIREECSETYEEIQLRISNNTWHPTVHWHGYRGKNA